MINRALMLFIGWQWK